LGVFSNDSSGGGGVGYIIEEAVPDEEEVEIEVVVVVSGSYSNFPDGGGIITSD